MSTWSYIVHRLLSALTPYYMLNARLEWANNSDPILVTKFSHYYSGKCDYELFLENNDRNSGACITFPRNLILFSLYTRSELLISRKVRLYVYYILFSGDARASDEGCARPTNFHSRLAASGGVELFRRSESLAMGRMESQWFSPTDIFAAKCVLLGTGHQSSWSLLRVVEFLFSSCFHWSQCITLLLEKIAEEVGIDRHAPQTEIKVEWDRKTL